MIRSAFAAPFIVGALAIAVFGVWAAKHAGYPTTTWYPGAIFLLALGVVAVLSYGRLSASRPVLVAIVLFGAFTVWNFLSILWASDQGMAWDGANRTALYFIVFAVFALLPWRRETVPLLLCGFSVVVLVIGIVELARAPGDVTAYFMQGRFSAPAGYVNANCALYLLAFWPAAYIAGRREVHPVVRGALLATATSLTFLAFLCQSRGSLFAVPIAIVAYLLVVPARLRAGLGLLVVALALLAARSRLLDVFTPIRDQTDVTGAVHDALRTIGIAAVVVFVVWTLVALLDRRLEFGPRAVRLANIGALTTVALALVAGAVVLAAHEPHPGRRLTDAWHNFKAGYPTQQTSSHFSLGLGSNRYDFWRVAVLEFRHHPIAGVGSDNFAQDYIRERRSDEEPLYPHSVELRVLAQTGLVGTLLFGGLLVAAGFAVARGIGGGSDLAGGAARAGVAAALYLGIHGSAEWFWEFPALTAPAVAWIGLAASRAAPAVEARLSRLAVIPISAVAALVAVSFALPWFAELEVQRALKTWSRDPGKAFSELNTARKLNPLTSRPDVIAGVIASKADDLPRMREGFQRALGRDSRLWYARLQLGLAESALGRRQAARTELANAVALNPSDKIVRSVARQVDRGERVDRRQVDRQIAARIQARLGP